MDTTLTTAYRLLVRCDGEPVSLSDAIDRVWAGIEAPDAFSVELAPVSELHSIDVPNSMRSDGMSPDTIASSVSEPEGGEVR